MVQWSKFLSARIYKLMQEKVVVALVITDTLFSSEGQDFNRRKIILKVFFVDLFLYENKKTFTFWSESLKTDLILWH